jgi:RNA polymerase sigma-32 factor
MLSEMNPLSVHSAAMPRQESPALGVFADLDRLVVAHMRLVVSVARRYRHYGVNMDDLIQEGAIGLMAAARRFDPNHGAPFSSYAIWSVKAAMRNYIFRNRSIVRFGRSSAQRNLFFKTAYIKPTQPLGDGILHEANKQSSAGQANDVTPARGIDVRAIARDISLNQPISLSGELEIQDVLGDDRPGPEEIVADKEEKLIRDRLVIAAVGKLTDRERFIIENRFLKRRATFQILANQLGISKERVRQIEKVALRKLKACVQASDSHPNLKENCSWPSSRAGSDNSARDPALNLETSWAATSGWP